MVVHFVNRKNMVTHSLVNRKSMAGGADKPEEHMAAGRVELVVSCCFIACMVLGL